MCRIRLWSTYTDTVLFTLIAMFGFSALRGGYFFSFLFFFVELC